MPLHMPTLQDQADAAAYWRTRERKAWAVDVVAGPAKRPTYAQTWYANSKTADGAIACVKREAWGLPSGGRYRARLAGPAELGCVPTGNGLLSRARDSA